MIDNSFGSALVVDDNWYNRDLAKLALRTVGFQVTEAENGVEALKILTNQNFNLMIVDLAMPEMGGGDLLRAVRGQSIHNNMCIIVVTANPHMTTSEIDGSADFVMHKPINIGEFAAFAERFKYGSAVGPSTPDVQQ